MMTPSRLTAFQARARSMLNEVFSDLGVEPKFEYVKCSRETPGVPRPDEHYILAEGLALGHSIEVFIYSDEIGFYCDGAWKVFESQDFREESVLMKTALQELRACVGNSP